MLKIQVSSPSPDASIPPPSLADLSRNASVLSSSSSSSSTSDLTQTPARPRPLRTFSSPRTNVRSRSPQSPTTPRASRPPAYLARELGLTGSDDEDKVVDLRPPQSRAQSKSRNSSVNGRISADDFDFGRILGEGSYSTVMLAKHRATQNEYAIKILDKSHLRRNGKLQTALAEKNTLVRLGAGHRGIVRLHWAFQDEWSLYFVLDLARNGELQSRISRLGSLSVQCARVYAAQIVDALGYMHSKGVIHRDLKPENLLLDDAFRIKITDFGTGKILDSGGERTKTFVGTAQYVSPELLEDSETSKSSDLWALGCIIYQMISGRFAYQGLSEYLTWQKIKQLDYSFPDGFDEEAKDLVQKLFVRDPAERLGAGPPGSHNDMDALRAHPFFASINWSTLWTDAVPPLEPGLVKKEVHNGGPNLQNWEDVGASWDELVSEGMDDDISWASDGEGAEHTLVQNARTPNEHFATEAVGPLGERRPYAFPPVGDHEPDEGAIPAQGAPESLVRFADVPQAGAEVVSEKPTNSSGSIPAAVKTQPIDVPQVAVADSHSVSAGSAGSAGSATSSSDGSPTEGIDAAMAAVALNRGRTQAQTPIQGNYLSGDPEWVRHMIAGEAIIFNTGVESCTPRRRASRLLAMAVPPKKKMRELVLTTHRLVCLKHKDGRQVQVRTQLWIKPPEKEKDQRDIVTAIEPKGEREFVVLTATKSHHYSADGPALASTWIRKIQEALDTESSTEGQVRRSSKSRT